MKILAGLGLLLVVFGLAALWQGRLLDELERERQRAASEIVSGRAPGGAGTDGEEDWAVLRVGRPSGAEPALLYRAPSLDPSPTALAQVGGRRHLAAGQDLFALATEWYGSASPELVRRLARYNGIPDASRVERAREVLLPPIAVLADQAP